MKPIGVEVDWQFRTYMSEKFEIAQNGLEITEN